MKNNCGHSSNAVYGLGMIGAAVFLFLKRLASAQESLAFKSIGMASFFSL